MKIQEKNDELKKLEQIIEEIKFLHRPHDRGAASPSSKFFCRECGGVSPCNTAKLAGAEEIPENN